MGVADLYQAGTWDRLDAQTAPKGAEQAGGLPPRGAVPPDRGAAWARHDRPGARVGCLPRARGAAAAAAQASGRGRRTDGPALRGRRRRRESRVLVKAHPFDHLQGQSVAAQNRNLSF